MLIRLAKGLLWLDVNLYILLVVGPQVGVLSLPNANPECACDEATRKRRSRRTYDGTAAVWIFSSQVMNYLSAKT